MFKGCSVFSGFFIPFDDDEWDWEVGFQFIPFSWKMKAKCYLFRLLCVWELAILEDVEFGFFF